MIDRRNVPGARPGRAALLRPIVMAALVLPFAACSLESILEVSDPDVATPETINDPANLSGLFSGALGDFMVAYGGNTLGGGGTEGIILSSGLLGDEFYVSDTFGTRQEVDRRRITPENSGMTNVFRNLHRARRAAEIAVERYSAAAAKDTVPPQYSAVAHATVTNLAAYSYTIFGENYCSGVPFSRLTEDNRLEHGNPWTTQQMFERALQGFRAARDVTGNPTQVRLSRIGEGRTLLDMGQFEAAAAVVASVPTSFVYVIEYSENTARQNNGVWGITHNRRGYGVAHREGGNGLPYRQGSSQDPSSQDPRVPYTRTNSRAIDSPYAHFWQLKYPQRGSAIPLATGIEARLIEAEAALRRDDLPVFLAKHNELRALEPGLAPLAGAALALMTREARENLHFQERAFWLWLTAQRLSDMRRLIRQYDRPSETVFPTGTYGRLLWSPASVPDDELAFRDHGITYGTDVNFPVPFDELNNPNFQECIDRNA